MKHIFTVICSAGMAALAFLLEIMGGWDAGLGLLFLLMALDIVTGLVISALRRSGKTVSGSFKSGQFFLGVTRKLLIIILVILGAALDGLLNSNVARLSVIGFYSANEAFSIIENAALAGVPFPGKLLDILELYRSGKDIGPYDGHPDSALAPVIFDLPEDGGDENGLSAEDSAEGGADDVLFPSDAVFPSDAASLPFNYDDFTGKRDDLPF